jgi:hypothetical protein
MGAAEARNAAGLRVPTDAMTGRAMTWSCDDPSCIQGALVAAEINRGES